MNWIKKEWIKLFSTLSSKGLYWFALFCCFFLVLLFYYYQHLLLLWAGMFLMQLAGLYWNYILRFEYALLSLITKPISLLVSTIILFVVFIIVILPIRLFKKNPYNAAWQEATRLIDSSKMYD